MGYNTRQFDHDAHYAAKSTNELQELLKYAEDFSNEHPNFQYGSHNVYIHKLKLLIAERIGKATK